MNKGVLGPKMFVKDAIIETYYASITKERKALTMATEAVRYHDRA